MKAHADDETLGQLLMLCFARDDRGRVAGGGAGGETPLPHEIFPELGRVDAALA